MGDVTPKVKVYVFLSFIVLLLNLSVIAVDGLRGLDSSNTLAFDFMELANNKPDGYDTMSREERYAYLENNHGGQAVLNFQTKTVTYPDSFVLTFDELDRFMDGTFYSNEQDFNYSDSNETAYITKVTSLTTTSFLPFTSVIVNVIYFDSVFPFNLIIGILVTLISALQLYYLIIMILNVIPTINV